MCCALLNDFNWVVPPYNPDIIVLGRGLDMEIPDGDREICVLSDEFPVVVDKTAVELLSLPVVVQTRPQVVCEPDLDLSERYVEVDVVDTRRNIRNLPGMIPEMLAAMPLTLPVDEEMDSQVGKGTDVVWTGRDLDMGDPDVGRDIRMMSEVGPMMIDGSDTGPLALPVVANTETQVDVRWEVTLKVVPSVVDGGCPAGWLDSESDDCVMDEIVLAPEMSPIVFMKSAVVPTFLPDLSEVCFLAVLAGGSVLRQPPWQSQRECLSCRMLEANFRRFMKLGIAPWMWSV